MFLLATLALSYRIELDANRFSLQGQGQQAGYGGQPPQGQYGGAPPQQPPINAGVYKQSLQQTIQERGLMSFYPPNSPVLDMLAQRATQQIDALCQRWRIPREVGGDLVKLGLYDIVLYVGQWHPEL